VDRGAAGGASILVGQSLGLGAPRDGRPGRHPPRGRRAGVGLVIEARATLSRWPHHEPLSEPLSRPSHVSHRGRIRPLEPTWNVWVATHRIRYAVPSLIYTTNSCSNRADFGLAANSSILISTLMRLASPGRGSQMRDRGRASGINARSKRTDPSAKAAIITEAHCSMMALCVACRDGIGDVGSVSPYPVDLLG
jgi:hypothetical protein